MKIIHTELVCEQVTGETPDRVLEEVIDRGERAVRRTLRAWPQGQMLRHRVQIVGKRKTVEWYFAPETPSGQRFESELDPFQMPAGYHNGSDQPDYTGWKLYALSPAGNQLQVLPFEGFGKYRFPQTGIPLKIGGWRVKDNYGQVVAGGKFDAPVYVPGGDALEMTVFE